MQAPEWEVLEEILRILRRIEALLDKLERHPVLGRWIR